MKYSKEYRLANRAIEKAKIDLVSYTKKKLAISIIEKLTEEDFNTLFQVEEEKIVLLGNKATTIRLTLTIPPHEI